MVNPQQFNRTPRIYIVLVTGITQQLGYHLTLRQTRGASRLTNIGLGAHPVVSLAEARKKTLENRRTIEQGLDPRSSRVPTFEQAAKGHRDTRGRVETRR